jgi:hypothetical protein
MSIIYSEEPGHEVPSAVVLQDATEDGHVFWFEGLSEHECRFGWDGSAGLPFTLVPQRSGRPFVWSPDRRHVAYYGMRQDRSFVGVDGREEGPYDDITRSVPPSFTADGRRLAYGAMIDGIPQLILDGDPVPGLGLAPSPVSWSLDGARLAYAEQESQVSPQEVRRDPAAWPRQRVVIDGLPRPWVENLGDLPGVGAFSPDGQHFAYVVTGTHHHVVVDDQAQHVFDAVDLLRWSPDSGRIAYVAVTGDRSAVVEGARVGPPYWRIGELAFSPDSSRLAYSVAMAKGRFVVVVDGEPGPEYADLWQGLAFSRDGRRLAYLAKRPGHGRLGRFKSEYVAVVDGSPGEAFEEVASPPHMSPDGRHIAFAARRAGAWSIVVDDIPGEPYDRVGPPLYGSQGALRFLAKRGKQMTVVTDGRPGPWVTEVDEIDGISMTVSEDDRHAAWVAILADGVHPVVDDTVGGVFQGVGAGVFLDDQTVRFPCLRGQRSLTVYGRW